MLIVLLRVLLGVTCVAKGVVWRHKGDGGAVEVGAVLAVEVDDVAVAVHHGVAAHAALTQNTAAVPAALCQHSALCQHNVCQHSAALST